MRRLLFCLLLLAVTSPALATDGVLEINQTCAVQTGCFPGDAAGFPVTFGSGGSYRLTSNLTPASVNAIRDDLATPVDHVTIDLAGFTIDGNGSTTNGIQLSGGNHWEIRGGTITGFASGIQQQVISSGHRVIGVRVIGNSRSGIAIANGEGHLVRDCTVEGNGTETTDRGIIVGVNSTVIGNTVVNNAGPGMTLGSGTGYAHNAINGNGDTVVGGVEIGGNVCDANATCP